MSVENYSFDKCMCISAFIMLHVRSNICYCNQLILKNRYLLRDHPYIMPSRYGGGWGYAKIYWLITNYLGCSKNYMCKIGTIDQTIMTSHFEWLKPDSVNQFGPNWGGEGGTNYDNMTILRGGGLVKYDNPERGEVLTYDDQ